MKLYEKGITLTALVITIVIILILVGTTIILLNNSGIINRTEEASNKYLNSQENELMGMNVLAEEIDESYPNLRIGDYVDYTVEEKQLSLQTLQELQKYSGYTGESYNDEFKIVQDDLKWRVLDFKDGCIRLISDKPTTSKIYLQGYNGYNNAVYLINKICDELYSSNIGKAKGMAIEDLEEHLAFDYKEETAISEEKYGEEVVLEDTDSTNYPSIYDIELGSKNPESYLDLSEQNEIINQTSRNMTDRLNIKITSWDRTFEASDFKDYNEGFSEYYNLFINNGDNPQGYIFASRNVFTYKDSLSRYANFGVSWLFNGISQYILYDSRDRSGYLTESFRPIITLSKDVKIDLCDGKNSADNMHKII